MDNLPEPLINSRIILISADPKIRTALSSVVGPRIELLLMPQDARVRHLPSPESVETVILELDSVYGLAARKLPGQNAGADSAGEAKIQELCAGIIAQGIPVVVMAGDDLRSFAQDLVERGAHSYVRYPPVVRDLHAVLVSACQGRRIKRELEATRQRLETLTGMDLLTGSSAPMQQVYKLIRKVSHLETSVLITGESGTGKELISRAIHNTGNRSKRRFVPVSCSAIPETLIEAELFGCERGAFTGSQVTREGYFEQAGDGTLFLDEIGELPLQTQVKLLRVLQEREFTKLGSTRSIPLRARVVLATHRDLQRLVAEGEFRQDLYYRINIMNIVAPELRRRVSDIPVLARHFVIKYSESIGKYMEGIEPDAITLMQRYSWPGNVRELENVIQRAIILADGTSVSVGDLPDEIQDLDCSPIPDDDVLPSGSFERQLRDFKTKLALDALQHCNGNKTQAAQSLSISRAYLHRLIRPVPPAGVTEIRNQLCA